MARAGIVLIPTSIILPRVCDDRMNRQPNRLAEVQTGAQQQRRHPGPAFERTPKIGSVMKAKMAGHRIIVLTPAHQAQGHVGAHLVQFGLKVAAVACEVPLQGRRADLEGACRVFQRGALTHMFQ